MAKKVSVDFYKKSRTIIILLGLLLMVYLFFTHKGKTTKEIGSDLGSDCGKHTCGGMHPILPYTCPDHCQCPPEDPEIPDAPRQCVPKV